MLPSRPGRARRLDFSSRLTPRARSVLSAAAIHFALAALFLSPALLSGGVILPAELLHSIYPWGAYFQTHTNHNSEITDAILVFYPFFTRWKDAVLSGEWPLWNPDSGLGLPFAANAQSACYFPLTFLSLLGTAGWNLMLLLRLVLAGLGTHMLLRKAGRSPLASLLGSIAYTYSLPFALWLPGPLTSVNALLPFLVLAALHVSERPGPRSAAGFGVALLAMHLAGNPEYTFFNAGAATIVVLIRSLLMARPAVLPATGWLLAGGTAGTIAAGVQILPFLEYLTRSRGWLELSTRSQVTVEPQKVFTWIAPLFFGRPMDRNNWAGGLAFIEFAAFAGTAVLGLALTGLLVRRARRLWIFVIPFVAVMAFAYGIPPVSWLRHVPPFDRTMVPRSLHIAALFLSVLAAFGWDALRAIRRRRGRSAALRLGLRAPAAIAAVTVLVVVWCWRTAMAPGHFDGTILPAAGRAILFAFAAPLLAATTAPGLLQKVLATSLVVFDLWHAIFNYHGAVPRSLVFFPTGVTEFLARQPDRPRVLPLRYALPPNTNLVYRFSTPLSFDAMDSLDQALFLRHLKGFPATGIYFTVFPEKLGNAVIAELASFEFFLDDPLAPRLDTPEFAARSGLVLERVYDQPDGRVYRLQRARPRVWFAGTTRPDPGFGKFQDLLRTGSPEIASIPYIDSAAAPSGEGRPGRVSSVRRRLGTIEVTCEAAGAGWLFFSEGYMPGWTATVNGTKTAVVRASGPFFAVPVPAGQSSVIVSYRPRSFLVGLLSSLAGAVVLVLLFRSRSPRLTRSPAG